MSPDFARAWCEGGASPRASAGPILSAFDVFVTDNEPESVCRVPSDGVNFLTGGASGRFGFGLDDGSALACGVANVGVLSAGSNEDTEVVPVSSERGFEVGPGGFGGGRFVAEGESFFASESAGDVPDKPVGVKTALVVSVPAPGGPIGGATEGVTKVGGGPAKGAIVGGGPRRGGVTGGGPTEALGISRVTVGIGCTATCCVGSF